jgi:malate dehydrogenase
MLRVTQRLARRTVVQSSARAGVATLPFPQRNFNSKVTVVGAAGGIGQPLSLLLATSPHVQELRLFDVAPITPGVACDLSHCDTSPRVLGFTGETGLADALKGSNVVVIPAGVPRKPGMTRDDLFATNAGIVANIIKSIAKNCPEAFILIISNPVNSTVPIAAELLTKAGVYNPKRLFGVTTLDVCRANKFVAENQKLDVTKVNVPVIGGHAGITILPLLSQIKGAKFSAEDKKNLTQRIMFGGDEVVKAKNGGGSATLSMAWAGFKFTSQIIRAARGEKGITECTYVQSSVVPDVPFFSTRVLLGKGGVETINGTGTLDDFEKQKLAEMMPELKGAIQKGVEFASKITL